MSESAGLHNAVHLAFAVLGIAMLMVALFDWVIHPITLWAAFW